MSILLSLLTFCWQCGVVLSKVRCTNEVNARQDQLVPSRYVISQLGQLSLASLGGHLIK